MNNCLIIFAKEPQSGRTKTRLLNKLSERQCLNLYKAFLQDTIAIAKKIKSSQKVLAYQAQNSPNFLRQIAPDFIFYKQRGNNLGQKMHNAFKFARENNARKIVIIGSDAPNLPAKFIENAFARLGKKDLVLGPSYDGGYYLVGLKNPHPDLFKGIKWSSAYVLAETLKKAGSLQKTVAILDKWYDVDNQQSLGALIHDLRNKQPKNNAVWTRRALTKIENN